MKYLIPGFFLLLAATAAVSLAFFYWKFRHSPASLWANRVRRRRLDLQGQIRPLDLPTDSRTKALRLRESLLTAHLKSIPSSAVIGFAGVGPGAVERLQNAGLPTLASLVRYDFERLPGIGPSKAADLKAAVRKLVADAEARFQAGGCLEGREYQRLWAEMAAADHTEREMRGRRNAAIERALSALQPLAELAHGVTFWNHLLHRGRVPGLTDEVMQRPLPDIVDEPTPALPAAVVQPVAPEVRVEAPLAAKRAGTSPPPALVDPFRQALPSAGVPASAAEHPQLPKLRAYCAFALVVAKSDGRIAKAERAEVRSLLASAFGHDTTLVRFIDPVMEQTEKVIPDEDDALAAILKTTTADERRMLHKVAERIADATGERGPREVDALRRIATALGVMVAPTVPLAGRASDDPVLDPAPSLARPANENRQLLEIDPTAPLSPDLIRRRFTLLTEKADPARAAALGPEFVRMAEAKRADLRRAALELLAPFGEPLVEAAPPKPTDFRHNPDLDDVFGA